MKYENILKELAKDKYVTTEGIFLGKEVLFVNGTALVDLTNGEVVPTTARYKDVFKQIDNNRSHIQDIEGRKIFLTMNRTMGY